MQHHIRLAIVLLMSGATVEASTSSPLLSPSTVGPPSFYQPAGSSPLIPGSTPSETYKALITAWSQMTNTQYAHQEQWYPKLLPPFSPSNPEQLADCVGAVSYILNLGAPAAVAEVYASIGLTDALYKGWSYVPRAQEYANFFVSLKAGTSPNWQYVSNVADIQAGDVLIIPASYANPTGYVGHALIAAGSPLLLSDGSYALLEFDSTSTSPNHTGGHGSNDTRYWDPRNLPCPTDVCSGDSGNGAGNNGPSGLGQGTVQISTLPTNWASQFQNYPFQIAWSVDPSNNTGSGQGYVGPLIVARPISQPHTAQGQCLFQWAQMQFPKALAPAATATTFTGTEMNRTYSKTKASLTFDFSVPGSVTYKGPMSSQINKIGSLQNWLNVSNCE
jgi:hypothetical protein